MSEPVIGMPSITLRIEVNGTIHLVQLTPKQIAFLMYSLASMKMTCEGDLMGFLSTFKKMEELPFVYEQEVTEPIMRPMQMVSDRFNELDPEGKLLH